VTRKTKTRVLAATVAVFLVAHGWIGFGFQPKMSDTRLYAMYAFLFESAARTGQSPYDAYESSRRDSNRAYNRPAPQFDEITIEYPPLALELLRAAFAFVADSSGTRVLHQNDIDEWTQGFRHLYFFMHAVVLILATLWLRRHGFACTWGLAVGTVAGVVLLYVLYDRLDLCLGFLLLAALAALVTGHRYLAMMALAAAVNLKLVPVLLVPLFLLGALPESVLTNGRLGRASLRAMARALMAFAASGLAIVLPFRLAWGPRVWDFLAYHGKRGLQIESTWSSLLLLAAKLGYPAKIEHVFGADEVVGPGTPTLAKASVVVMLGVLFMIYAIVWRSIRRASPEDSVQNPATSRLTLAEQRPQLFVWGSFAVLSAAMATSKVFSPQYLCWFLPALLLVEPARRIRESIPLVVFLVACGLTTLVYPVLWSEMVRASMKEGQVVIFLPTLRATLLVLGRNSIWVAFCVLALIQLRSANVVAQAVSAPGATTIRKSRRHRR